MSILTSVDMRCMLVALRQSSLFDVLEDMMTLTLSVPPRTGSDRLTG